MQTFYVPFCRIELTDALLKEVNTAASYAKNEEFMHARHSGINLNHCHRGSVEFTVLPENVHGNIVTGFLYDKAEYLDIAKQPLLVIVAHSANHQPIIPASDGAARSSSPGIPDVETGTSLGYHSWNGFVSLADRIPIRGIYDYAFSEKLFTLLTLEDLDGYQQIRQQILPEHLKRFGEKLVSNAISNYIGKPESKLMYGMGNELISYENRLTPERLEDILTYAIEHQTNPPRQIQTSSQLSPYPAPV